MLLQAPSGGVANHLMMAVILLLAVVFASAVWVYGDAKALAGRGIRITSSLGSLQLKTPAAWFVACLLFWEMAFPLYLDSRNSA